MECFISHMKIENPIQPVMAFSLLSLSEPHSKYMLLQGLEWTFSQQLHLPILNG